MEGANSGVDLWATIRSCSCLHYEYYAGLVAPTGSFSAMRKPAAPVHDFSLRAQEREQRSPDGRICVHGTCKKPAHHRAPRFPGDRKHAQWLCQEHARERNLNWNYYRRMTATEIDAARRAAIIWDRPTWPAAQAAAGVRSRADTSRRAKHTADYDVRAPRRTESHRRALAILGLQAAATPVDIRNRFRKLLRLLHPDMNAGRHVDATRLRAVIWAWRELRPASTARTQ